MKDGCGGAKLLTSLGLGNREKMLMILGFLLHLSFQLGPPVYWGCYYLQLEHIYHHIPVPYASQL